MDRIAHNTAEFGFDEDWQAEALDGLWQMPMGDWPDELRWFVFGYMSGKAYCGELHAAAIAAFLKTNTARDILAARGLLEFRYFP